MAAEEQVGKIKENIQEIIEYFYSNKEFYSEMKSLGIDLESAKRKRKLLEIIEANEQEIERLKEEAFIILDDLSKNK